MTFRNVMILSLALMISFPVWARAKKSQDKELAQIYQTVIRDSQKKLSPQASEQSIYLPTSPTQGPNRSPASVSATATVTPARHAALPWAADASVGSRLFSVK